MSRRGDAPGSRWYDFGMRALVALLTIMIGAARAAAESPADPVVPLDTFDAFEAAAAPLVPPDIRHDARLWRQIAPSVRWILVDHVADFRRLPTGRQRAAVGELAVLLVDLRKQHSGRPVIGPGRPITALLDPDRGLDPKQITGLAAAYGTTATVFKQQGDRTRGDVAKEFLEALRTLARDGSPATVVVIGHGLPKEIQSYSIPVEDVARGLVPGGGTAIDLGHLTLAFDDCFSADFCRNLAAAVRSDAESDGLTVTSLPVLIAGANRDRYGLVDIGEKFVTRFWDSVIELYYVRKPRPAAVTIADFQGPIDNFMYGNGRAPIFDGTRVAGYRLVDPSQVQDPVCFLPLTPDQERTLRRLLGMAEDAPVLPILDAG